VSDSWPEDWPIAAIQEIETRDARIAELERNRITEEQIDMLWKRRSFYSTEPIDDCIAAICIVPCSECGGSGLTRQAIDWTAVVDCPTCHRNGASHGWMWRNND
jgi:hypothetical protein